ncbi:hypothetical protein S4A8_07125 [Salinisphaera sp. S4-8]|uniref:M90 family metallopeptidase n=1 Tax=Salinisphaera sp. S4-8 TaxID=633357 RepID=UPI00333F23BC
MNTIAALTVIGASLVAAAGIIAYPRLRLLVRGPAKLNAAERARLWALLPWRGLLDTRQRERLPRLAARLVADVRFVGCQGLDITPDMRLAIAGQASLLCLGATPATFALPSEVLIYPDAFYIPQSMPDEQGLVDDVPMLASGEAWHASRVVLSWADVEAALAGAAHNVVLHEFAHLLDFAAPAYEGAPPTDDADGWRHVFGAAFETLRERGSPVIDIYGAENPAEFFAVTVEAFFQRGAELAGAHDELYRLMAAYFDIDTARQRPEFGDLF